MTKIKPRSEVTHSHSKPGLTHFLEVSGLEIAAWCPDDQAQAPPEQVHLVLRIQDLDDYPFLVRFKSPDTLGFLIQELTDYRHEVWPDAQPVEDRQIQCNPDPAYICTDCGQDGLVHLHPGALCQNCGSIFTDE